MKNLKLLGLLLVLFFGSFALVGCGGDDDDDNGGDAAQLVGSWLETRVEGWEMDSKLGKEDLTENIPADEAATLTLNANGTFTVTVPDKPSHSYSGTYVYNEARKEISVSRNGRYEETYKVEKLTSSKLVIITEDDEDAFIRTIYKRLK